MAGSLSDRIAKEEKYFAPPAPPPVTNRPPPSGGGGSSPSTPSTTTAVQAGNIVTKNSSGYFHPSNGVGKMTGVWHDPRPNGRLHKGQDIRMPMNTPLIAVTSGQVKYYKNASAGTVIYLLGDDGNKYSYFHLNQRTVANGSRVTAGTVIAMSGNSGNSAGPHLHFEVTQNGRKVDPRNFLASTGSGSIVRPKDTMEARKQAALVGIDQLTPDLIFPEEEPRTLKPGFPWSGAYPLEEGADPQWMKQLEDYRAKLRQDEPITPLKRRASAMLHSTLSNMSNMIRKYGFDAGGTVSGAQATEGTAEPIPRAEET